LCLKIKLYWHRNLPEENNCLNGQKYHFSVIVKETDESYPLHLPVNEVAMHIAYNKAMEVKKKIDSNEPILAADTIVVLDAEIIGKPTDRANAIQILTKLSGKKHHVITGVVILYGDKLIQFSDTSEVEFYTLTQEQIEFYVDNYKPYDKAGAYAIQEWIGVTGIKSIQGDFYNIMGLPVSKVIQALHTIF
jgi:septum formation protein